MNEPRTVDHASGPYTLLVASERSDRLVQVRNPAADIYWVALDNAGHAIVCTCQGYRARQVCKHLAMVREALENGGLPLRTDGRLEWNPVDGYQKVDQTDLWDRITPGRDLL